MHNPTPHDDVALQGLSRRGLLRGVAWAAPVIIVASAAPSAAASGGEIEIDWTNFTVSSDFTGDDFAGVSGNFTIQRVNDVWNGPNLTQVTATVTFETRLGLSTVPGDVDLSGSASEWSLQSVSPGVTFIVYTFVWNGVMAPYGNTGILDYEIPTTIVADESAIVPYTVTGYANSPEVVASIAASDTET